jgi:hypothetical protein
MKSFYKILDIVYGKHKENIEFVGSMYLQKDLIENELL